MTFQARVEPSLNEEPAPPVTGGDELPMGTELCFGQYRIERFLNSGGFGITYLARDSLDRRVVIKECYPGVLCHRQGLDVRLRASTYAQDFDYLMDLFKREAHALARLKHPGVVNVHQIFEANNTAYMALDFVAGLDLFEVMENYPDFLTPSVIQSLARQVLAALDYVHENGILHRDISPDNILLDNSHAPVLIDFGASRVGQARSSRVLSRIYTVKDGYSPQEFYFEGRFQSPASDLYAFAATLYHLITTSCPPNSSERLSAISEGNEDPYTPLSGRFPAYPAAFLERIDTAMNLFAKERMQSAADWLQCIGDEGPTAQETAPEGPQVRPPARADHETLRQIYELVEENREDMDAGDEEPADAHAEFDAQTARQAEKRAREIEYWSILNEDPEELARAAEKERAKAKPKVAKEADTPPPRGGLYGLLSWGRRRRKNNAKMCG
ncbi:MAG: protein kinase [Pseudomonadota bacterium]